VITMSPGSPPQIPPFRVNRRNPPGKLGSGSRGFTFLGVIDPTRMSAPGLRFFPKTSRIKAPESFLSSLQPLTNAGLGGVGSITIGGVPESQVNVMHCRHPCSFPNAHPAGCPVTGVVNPRLVSSWSGHEDHKCLTRIRASKVEVRIQQVRIQDCEVLRLDHVCRVC
jgi:hypothetical protein